MDEEQHWDPLLHAEQENDAIECNEKLIEMSQDMTMHDITKFIEVLAVMHKCEAKDISYFYNPIFADEGNLLVDELTLMFNLKALTNGEIIDREIHSIRVKVPQEVQQRAQAMIDFEQRLQEKPADSPIVARGITPPGPPRTKSEPPQQRPANVANKKK